jgi:hypothetical protein
MIIQADCQSDRGEFLMAMRQTMRSAAFPYSSTFYPGNRRRFIEAIQSLFSIVKNRLAGLSLA